MSTHKPSVLTTTSRGWPIPSGRNSTITFKTPARMPVIPLQRYMSEAFICLVLHFIAFYLIRAFSPSDSMFTYISLRAMVECGALAPCIETERSNPQRGRCLLSSEELLLAPSCRTVSGKTRKDMITVRFERFIKCTQHQCRL